MATSDTMRSFRLRLTTVTPVSIGDDEAKTLSPYADYVFDQNGERLIYLQKDVIEKAFLKDGQVDSVLLSAYVEGISGSMDNNRSNFNLKSFIQNQLQLPLDGEVMHKSVPVYGLTEKLKQHIRTIQKSAGALYLPGSSIKGAIRTAVLYDWLVKTKAGEEAMEKLGKELQIVGEIKNKTPNPRDISRNDREKIRTAEGAFFPETELFGNLKTKTGPDARRIRVSDSTSTQKGLRVMAMKRIRLTPNPRFGGKAEIPLPREVFFTNTPLECSIGVLKGFQNSALQYWENDTPDKILALLNGFTLDAIENEIYELEHASGGPNGEEQDALLDFYQTLRNRALNGEVFFRMGFGKTIYDNSLALSVLNGISDPDQADEAFDVYRRNFWRMNRFSRVYPATRTITPDNLPLGWVKVEVIEQ